MTLGEVAAAIGGRLDAGTDPEAIVSGAVTTDSRLAGPGDLFVAVAGARVDGHDYAAAAVAAGAIAVLAAHPVGVPAVLVDDPVLGLGRLARAVRERLPELTVIGVTGSVGKTSTKDLLAAVLARAGSTVFLPGNLNNEIGFPLVMLQADAGTRFLIAEMGARGAGHIAYLCEIARPDLGVVLNVGSAHAGEFGGREATARAKGELVEALPPGGVAVLNADDPLVATMAARTRARVVFTTRRDEAGPDPAAPARITAGPVRLDARARAGFDLITPQGCAPVRLAIHGEHQVANALAAAAVGLEFGLSPEEVAAALSGASAASHWRMEVMTRPDGLVVVNDAYNANPESMTAALRALRAMSGSGPAPAAHWAVLGEMAELGPESDAEHRKVGRHVVGFGLAGLITVGAGATAIADAARDAARQAGREVSVLSAEGVDEALVLVQQNVRRTDVVLIKASRFVGLERLAAGLLTGSKRRETA